ITMGLRRGLLPLPAQPADCLSVRPASGSSALHPAEYCALRPKLFSEMPFRLEPVCSPEDNSRWQSTLRAPEYLPSEMDFRCGRWVHNGSPKGDTQLDRDCLPIVRYRSFGHPAKTTQSHFHSSDS